MKSAGGVFCFDPIHTELVARDILKAPLYINNIVLLLTSRGILLKQ